MQICHIAKIKGKLCYNLSKKGGIYYEKNY